MKKKYKLFELFSGIGAQARSLEKISSIQGFRFSLEGTCEWDVHAILAYYLIHKKHLPNFSGKIPSIEKIKSFLVSMGVSYNGKNPMTITQINLLTEKLLKDLYIAIKSTNNYVNIKKLRGSQIPDEIDIMTYSFPCQDLSSVGAFHGFKNGIDKNANTRSGLLWEVERLLFEMKDEGKKLPRFLIMENVATLYAPRHKDNFEEWKKILEKFGYLNFDKIYLASDFGVPQTRKRVIMLSVLGSNDKSKILNFLKEEFNNFKTPLIPLDNYISFDNYNLLDEKLQAQPNDTPSRVKIWNENNQIYTSRGEKSNQINTITTKQDRHPNSGNIFFDYEGNKKSKFRFLTARETMLLMGFENPDYEVLKNSNYMTKHGANFFGRDVIYKLAGNSIVVEMLNFVIQSLNKLDKELL